MFNYSFYSCSARLDKIMVDEGEEAYLEEKKAIEDANAAEEDPVFEPPTVSNQILKILPYEDKFYLSLVSCFLCVYLYLILGNSRIIYFIFILLNKLLLQFSLMQ